MADDTKEWLLFDADSGLVPDELSPSLLPDGGKGRVVALAATPFARAGGWADRAVVAIAKTWSLEDLRIFLMDLDLESPSLHDALGLLNKEGVSDAFLYGASVQKIAQPALNEAIFFAPAGTVTSDPEQVLGHPRWSDLAGGFSEADATLLLFLPTDIPGAEKTLSWATDILFISGQEELPEDHLGPAAVKVAYRLGPEGAPAREPDTPPDAPESADSGLESPEGPVEGTLELTEEPALEEEPGLGADDFGLGQGISLVEGFGDFAGTYEDTVDSVEEREGQDRSEDMGRGQELSDEIEPDQDLSVASSFGDDFILETAEPFEPTLDEEASVRSEPGSELLGEDMGSGELPAYPAEVPDFGADFVEMPDLEEGAGAEQAGDPMGEVALTGPDFVPDPAVAPSGDPAASGGGGSESGPPDSLDKAEGDTGPKPPDRSRPRRRPPPKKLVTRKRAIGGGVVLLLLITAGGTATGLLNVPGFMWLQHLLYEVPPPPLTLGGPEANEPTLRFSLELPFGQDDFGLALEMRNTLKDRRPDLLFYLSPMERDGMVRYVLYAGPAVDLVDVENLRSAMEEVFDREDSQSWPVVVTTRAFYLGERGTLAEAQEYLASLEEQGIVGYILHATYPDGTEGYVIYSGAFEGIDDARWWQLFLRDAGLRDVPLIERRGRLPE
jgi:hypothetical protein